MSAQDWTGEKFYTYAMELFFKAGHVATLKPEFINHSPEQFAYFDNKSDIALSKDQRNLFEEFNKVSRLFSVNDCVFFSINLSTTKTNRSQTAHDIHTMIHPIVKAGGTICLFRFEDEVMLSFSGFGVHSFISDWYPMIDDNEILLEKLDIANMSTKQSIEYFLDIVYMLARPYYLAEQPSPYDLLPIRFISDAGFDGVDREEINQFVQDQINALLREYGDDYVEYDESLQMDREDIRADLDLMFLEMVVEDDNPFGEELDDEEDLDESFDEDTDNTKLDEYEFDDVDPEIFRDPSLMVKWLNHHSQNES